METISQKTQGTKTIRITKQNKEYTIRISEIETGDLMYCKRAKRLSTLEKYKISKIG